MIIYQVYSEKAQCDLQLKYGENGRLLGIELMQDECVIDENVRVGIFANAPSSIGILKQLALKHKWNMVEIKPDLSFDKFWKIYNNTNGSKIKAAQIWDKMTEKNKNLAINYIHKYKQSLGATTQAYATTYLNQQYWIK